MKRSNKSGALYIDLPNINYSCNQTDQCLYILREPTIGCLSEEVSKPNSSTCSYVSITHYFFCHFVTYWYRWWNCNKHCWSLQSVWIKENLKKPIKRKRNLKRNDVLFLYFWWCLGFWEALWGFSELDSWAWVKKKGLMSAQYYVTAQWALVGV